MQKMKQVSLISTLKRTFSTLLIFLLSAGQAVAYEASNCGNDDFEQWQECIFSHFSQLDMSSDFMPVFDAKYLERVVELDQRQPEKKLYYREYLKRINIDKKIADAKHYLAQNRALLNQAAKLYQVEPEAIVALIAVESDLGRRMGQFDIVSSLATLAYDGRRKDFFEEELYKSLQIKTSLGQNFDMLGSWAGAMGQCQFMPSSYLNFAVDTNNKGYADIWHDKNDVYNSVANYLHNSGWKVGQNLVQLAKATAKCNLKSCEDSNNRLISLEYDANIQRLYKVGSNYQVLMKWNRSSYFGVTVLKIINAIKHNNAE